MKRLFLVCLTLLETIYGYPQENLFDLVKDSCPNEKKMPNIGYIFKGYDIYKGNPLPTGEEIIDHGFVYPIFEANYDEGKLTPDGRYCVPESTEILAASGCSLDFGREFYSGTYDYTKTLGFHIGFTANVPGGSFGASLDFGHIQHDTQSYENIFTHSDATCITYVVKNLPYVHPPFTSSFKIGLQMLPEEFGDGYAYYEFIGYFGTHYVMAADMGALFGRQLKISTSSWSHMQSTNINIGMNVVFDVMKAANASLDASIGYNKTEYEEFKRQVTEEKSYARGAPPPNDFKGETWMAETKENPAPMRLELKPLSNLLLFFEDDEVTQQVKDNLKQALENYCSWLMGRGELTSCSPPPPDPPIPQFRQWSWWATDQQRHSKDYPPKSCAENQYVTQMMWRGDDHNGLTDVRIKCSGKSSWEYPITNNDEGNWLNIMDCEENQGFKQVAAREYHREYTDVVNVKALCSNGVQNEIFANNDSRGEWEHELLCADGKMVGIQVKQDTEGIHHDKLTNFKIQCAY